MSLRVPRTTLVIAVFLILGVLAAGCGGGGESGGETSSATTEATEEASASEEATSEEDAASEEESESEESESESEEESEEDSETSSSAASGGSVVIDEGFDDNSNQWSPEDPEFEAEVGGGQMTFSVADTLPEDFTYETWPSAIDGQAETLSDVRVETAVSFTAPATVGLTCRLADPVGEDLSEYQFVTSAAGVAVIRKSAPDGTLEVLASNPPQEELQPGEVPENPAFEFQPDRLYELAGECVGGEDGSPAQLSFTIDGEEVASAEDPDPITNGIGGVFMAQSTLLPFEPFGIAYDSFTLTDLSSE